MKNNVFFSNVTLFLNLISWFDNQSDAWRPRPSFSTRQLNQFVDQESPQQSLGLLSQVDAMKEDDGDGELPPLLLLVVKETRLD